MFGALWKEPKRPAKLPTNRLDQFGDIMRFDWRSVMLLSIISSIFFLPLVIWMFISTTVDSALYADMLNATQEEAVKIADELKTHSYINWAVNIPLIAIAFMGLSGLIEILKKIAWGANVEKVSDYFKSVKKNLVSSLILGIIYGLICGAIVTSNLFFNESVIWNIIGFTIIGLASLFFIYALMLNVFYKQTVFNLLFNSFIFTVIRMPVNLICLAFILLPIVMLFFLPSILAVSLCCLIYLFIWLGMGMLSFVLNGCSAFDKHINKELYPDVYRKGLWGEKQSE